MRIQELRIAGFKSFVDPVGVRIEEGLTGVVGPNGCGKSNILESIRWVMGAASARALRGGDMDDVIFAGADNRPARDLAEVTLALDNSARTAPPAWNDGDVIEVTRRIRRGAGSSFRINGREARARDVQLLFADASTGANSPALVRQGQVSELINAKPENRRRILEEAAGVAGLHARRHEAEGKLRAAETNLGRLDEVIGALEGQLRTLQRQMAQAARYRALAEEIRGLEAFLLAARLAEAHAAAAAGAEALTGLERVIGDQTAAAAAAQRAVLAAEDDLPKAREEQAIAEALLRRHEGARIELDRAVQAAREARDRAAADIARIRADQEREQTLAEDAAAALDRLAEDDEEAGDDAQLVAAADAARTTAADADAARGAAEAALAAALAQASEAEGRRAALAQAARDAEARAGRLGALSADAARALEELPLGPPTGEMSRAAAALAAAEAEVEAARAAAEEAERGAEEAEAAERAAREAARAAEAGVDRLKAEVQGLEAVARRAQAGGERYRAALEATRAAPGYERALAAALGDDLNAALDAAAPAHWAGADARAIVWPAGVAPLADHVTAPDPLAARLAFVGVCADGAALARTLPAGARLVSLRGDLWRWDGLVRRAEAASPAAVLLEQRNRLDQLKAETAAAETARAAAAATASAARTAAETARAAARSARARGPAALQALGAARAAVARLEAEAERAAASRTAKEEAAARLTQEAEEAAAAAAAAAGALAAAPAPSPAETLSALRQEAEAARAEAAAARAAALQSAADLEARRKRRADRVRDLETWTRRKAQAADRLTALATALDAALAARAAAEDAPREAEDKRRALLDQLPGLEARRAAAGDALAAIEAAIRAAREAERAAEAALAEAREQRGTASGRIEAARTRIADLEEQARTSLRAEPDELDRRARAGLGEEAIAALTADAAERRLERLLRERDGLGAVNLAADEQAAEQSTRLEAMESEKADLTAAIAKLRAAIAEINEEGRERLIKAFDVVQGHFRALFETLFEGGQAELRLAMGEDPLSGGLEILACPPGKKLQTMSLLSGGEQALTASALIFAVFLSNPAPLCVLDEVDAPLDDANVDRYCRLLDEMRKRTDTRFLVITHHPLTMARMDRLYGVTMAERGVSQLVSVDLRRAEELVAG